MKPNDYITLTRRICQRQSQVTDPELELHDNIGRKQFIIGTTMNNTTRIIPVNFRPHHYTGHQRRVFFLAGAILGFVFGVVITAACLRDWM